jgi:hypothetical protein
MTQQAGNNVTTRFVDHSFLLEFNTRYLSNMQYSKVILVFSIVDDSGMSKDV